MKRSEATNVWGRLVDSAYIDQIFRMTPLTFKIKARGGGGGGGKKRFTRGKRGGKKRHKHGTGTKTA